MPPRITITSPRPNTDHAQTLAILRGTVSASISHVHISTRRPSRQISTPYPVVDRHFIALYHLQPGRNTIHLSLTSHLSNPVSLTLLHTPPPPDAPSIRLVYLLSSDADGSFQSPHTHPSEYNILSGVLRLQTAGLLIQAATADMLHAHGLGRRTFALATDVLVHRLNLTTAKTHTMSGVDLWQHVLSDLSNRAPFSGINLAVMSFSAMVDGTARAHTALGGGNLALFGGASLFTWPSTLHDVPTTFTDASAIDDKCFFDDSAGRACTRGRCAISATTIGALLHELGHCLSLPHPCGQAARDGGGIMARGFDDIDRLFVQPRSGLPRPFWDRGSAVRLRHHRFIYLPGGGHGDVSLNASVLPMATPTPTPRVDMGVRPSQTEPPRVNRTADGTVTCRSPVGIGHVGFYKNGDNAAHAEFPSESPKEFVIPALEDLRRMCEASASDKLKISVIDVHGHITEIDYDNL